MNEDEREGHEHHHGPGCGHRQIRHGDHADYLHDGHLDAPDGTPAPEHRLEVDRRRPAGCAPIECPGQHASGSDLVPHGDHQDFAVGGVLHHPHGDHCDLHGKL